MAERRQAPNEETAEPKAQESPQSAEAQAPAAEESPQAAAETVPSERLIREATAFLGVESYVVAGALYGQHGELTVPEAQKRVEEYLSAPVREG